MRKTSFAGLTELDPGESLFSDGGSFTARNPDITDYFLQLGARLHHHDAAPALADPTDPLALELFTDGGALPSDTTVMVTYTLIDDRGGETLPAPAALVTTAAGIDAPAEQPLTELLDDAGTLTIGSYHYAVTVVDSAGGETLPSPVATVVRNPGPTASHIRISGLADLIADTPGAVRYRLYRAKDTGTLSLLADGTVDIIDDDGSVECDCGTHPPQANTTGQTGLVLVHGPGDAGLGLATAWRLYVTIDGSFVSPSQFGATRTLDQAYNAISVDQILVDEGAPPDVSTAVAGAAQIDPDTDLLDWHWKRPVATVGVLPIGSDTAEGDMRLVLADGSLYSYRDAAWGPFTAPAAYWLPPVPDVASLPAIANTTGDVRVALDAFTLHAWDGAAWQPVAGTGGGGGHTIADELTPLPARTWLAFVGAGVTATDDAGGDRTVVTVPGQELTFEGAGVSVAGDIVTIPGGAGHVIDALPARSNLTFAGEVSVTDDAPGDQTLVTIGASRAVVNFLQLMAAAEVATPDLALPKGFRLLKLTSSVAVRVELYTTAAARTADAGRPTGTPPTGPAHGVLIDLELDAGITQALTPAIDGWNDDGPPADVSYARVTALAAGDVSLDLTIVRTEA